MTSTNMQGLQRFCFNPGTSHVHIKRNLWNSSKKTLHAPESLHSVITPSMFTWVCNTSIQLLSTVLSRETFAARTEVLIGPIRAGPSIQARLRLAFVEICLKNKTWSATNVTLFRALLYGKERYLGANSYLGTCLNRIQCISDGFKVKLWSKWKITYKI